MADVVVSTDDKNRIVLNEEAQTTLPKHPLYTYWAEDWDVMRDTQSSRDVKAQDTTYLPKTEGMTDDKQSGDDRYDAYKMRAIFYALNVDTEDSMLGIMHSKPAQATLPAALADIEQNATRDGASLQKLLRRVNKHQIRYGRVGLLADIPDRLTRGPVRPNLLLYNAYSIVNWLTRIDETGEEVTTFALLNESRYEMDDNWHMGHRERREFRVLALDGEGYYYTLVINEDWDNKSLNFDILNPPPELARYPLIRGERMRQIPFTFIGVSELRANPEMPPLLKLANVDLAIYRHEADYRLQLFLQGQDTFWATGVSGDFKPKLGPGGALVTENENAQFGFIGVDSQGLPESRTALENLLEQGVNMGVALLERDNSQESGKALQIRAGIKGASMRTIAQTGAEGVQRALRFAAEFAGADPEAVEVTANGDFSSAQAETRSLLEMWQTKLSGAPISARTFHKFLKDNEYTALSYDDEIEEIEDEGPSSLSMTPRTQNGNQTAV